MKKTAFSFFALILFSLHFKAVGQSIFDDGQAWKFAIPERGIYKIDYQLLLDLGINPSNIKPENISIYTGREGMLPQRQNSGESYKTLEIAIKVVGKSDNSFDNGDYILFYAEGADEVLFYEESDEIFVEKNLYDTVNYCFLKINETAGARIETKSKVTGTGDVVTTFDKYVQIESELVNINFSGRYWFGENLAYNENQSESGKLRFKLYESISSNSTIKGFTNVLSTAQEKADLKYSINGKPFGTLSIPKYTKYAYGNQGIEKSGYFEINSSQPGSADTIELYIENATSSGYNIYLDYVTLNFKQDLVFNNEPLLFQSFETVGSSTSTFRIKSPDGVSIWNVTDPTNAMEQPYTYSENEISFSSVGNELENYVIFLPSNVPRPQLIEEIDPYSLSMTTELLIVTHKKLLSEARRLADFREENDGLKSAVVTVDQIYNIYSSGRQDVTAIRNYIKDVYSGGELKYVLLFGDASYDYKNTLSTENTNVVPTYQSRNSVHNVHSYASDDYYAFMEDHEGTWSESGANLSDHTMDIGVGRLPVNTTEEAKAMVDKLIHYASGGGVLGDWRNHIAFFADDGDDNIHQFQSDYLADYTDQLYPQFTSNKYFMDKYPKELLSNNRKRSPLMAEKLNESVKNGSLIVDFIGHGSESAWTNESILTTDMFADWNNLDNLPLFITATCEFGRYDDWRKKSAAEQLVLSGTGGSIAMLTTTRPVFFTTNFSVSSSFYENAFEKIGGEWPRLGDVFRLTKNNSIEDLINRNFSLLGDPSMRLAYPEKRVTISEKTVTKILETENGNFVEMVFQGLVHKNDAVDKNFSGELEYKLFDKKMKVTTLGNEGPETAFEYYSRENILSKGKTSITNGSFELTLLIPEEFSDATGIGKMNFYAINESSTVDAAGSVTDFSYDSTGLIVEKDSIPPAIRFFAENAEISNGKKLFRSDVISIAINDEYGVKLFENDTIHLINGAISGATSMSLKLSNDYEPDAGSSKSGIVELPLETLNPGNHVLSISATDLVGNQSTHSIDFHIIEKSELLVYPNPAVEFINFRLTTPSALKENPDFDLQVYNYSGQLVRNFISEGFSEIRIDKSNYPELFTSGIYIFRATLKASNEVIAGKFVVR